MSNAVIRFQIASGKRALRAPIALLLAALASYTRPLLACEHESAVSRLSRIRAGLLSNFPSPTDPASRGFATANQEPPEQHNQHLHVNPLTGLVSALGI